MKYKDIISIDANFQNSINIGLDLQDEEKVNSYIPTTTGVNYLNHYISNILESNGEKSSMLIAPYGKGKSHAVLVLLSLLFSNNHKVYKKLLDRISEIDVQLLHKINKIEDKKFLPVIVSNTRGSLNQSLFFSMQKALNNVGINEILIQTDFDQAFNRIQEWKNNYPETYNRFLDELKARKISYCKFTKAIKSFDEPSLIIFKEIHKLILSGAEFVSHNSIEIIDYYEEISNRLIEDFGYDGVYVVFDEFSKFLESREEKTISNDMKIIQDLAELCNNSKKSNSYLQLIMHKPINDYLSIDKKTKNAFKGIEGRVSPYYFVSNLKSSFDLISNVIQKNEHYNRYKINNAEIYKQILKDINKIPVFYSEFNEEFIEEKLLDHCFPLHPLTSYLLIKINEKVAQNERTLFTFLSKNTTNSLASFLDNEIEKAFLSPTIVFDYFMQLFLEEKDNINVQKTASKAISALNNVDTDIEKTLIKVLALILIVNEKDVLPTNISVLSAASMITKEKCVELVNSLVQKGILIQRHGGQIQFKINMDLNLDSMVNNIVSTKYSKINVEKELRQIVKDGYYYPRTYNIINSITRFYKVDFMLAKDFLRIDSVNHFFASENIDGLVLNLIRDVDVNEKDILSKVNEIKNDRLVVVLPSEYNEYVTHVRRILAVKYLMEDTEFIDNNPLIKTELELLFDDLKNCLNELIENDFSFSRGTNHIYCSYNNGELNNKERLLSKNRILGDIFNSVFNRYPNCFNLELINKNEVKGTYKKARECVVDRILNNSIKKEELGTSPEDTIINCILVETGIVDNNVDEFVNEILTIIQEFFDGDNNNFGCLYSILMQPPYGLRKGVIPILLANVIKNMQQCVLLSFKGQEVEMNGYYLELLNDNPDDFTYTIDEINTAKSMYIENLGKMFDCKITSDMPKNYSELATKIRQWYISLPKFTKQMIGVYDKIKTKRYKILKKQLSQTNINSSELILFYIPKIVETNDLDNTINEFAQMKRNLDTFIDNYLIELKYLMNDILDFNKETNISKSINFWIDENQKSLDKKILSNSIKELLSVCKNSKNDTEFDLINKIAYCFTSFFVEDWSDITRELFITEFSKLKQFNNSKELETDLNNKIAIYINGEKIEKNIDCELDDSIEIVENFIESTMEDFGDSLTNEQKISLLVKIMKKYF